MDSESKQKHDPPLCPYACFTDDEEGFRWTQFGERPPSIPIDQYQIQIHSLTSILCPFCSKSFVGTKFHFCDRCYYTTLTRPAYHKECIQPISKHPYHPKHSLLPRYNRSPRNICLCCSDVKDWVYNCFICVFTICVDCARKPPLFEINHPTRHEHTLLFFPRKQSLICDVCGLSDNRSFIYSCLRCDFVVHKECIYFPCIIRISRHEHRVSFNSSLTPEKWLCGVCRENIDTKYGRYLCSKGCSYGVHSKCATRKDVWDGKELEGTPEVAYEDIKSFEEISDGVIQHFSHQKHHMRLDEATNRAFDENRRCQACTRPICDEIIYNCTLCDFTLHQACAHLPRRKQHMTHPHPLSLQADHQKGWFICDTCDRKSNGFMYMCYERDCDYILDVCCASLSEPLDHWCHPHPMFLTYKRGRRGSCSICDIRLRELNCGDCDFGLCFRCATLPNKVGYKHDEHYLIFSYDENGSSQCLCDACEEEADQKHGIYMCNCCNVTMHIQCLLGEKEMFLKPGGIIHDDNKEGRNVNIFLNSRLTRNIFTHCHDRCQEKLLYKISDTEILCSFHCLWWHTEPTLTQPLKMTKNDKKS